MDIKKKKNQTHKYTWEKNLRNDKKKIENLKLFCWKNYIYIYIYIYINLSYLTIILCVNNKYEFYKYIFTTKLH